MRALRVTVEAPICSFRHPHFVVGRQPSFRMPPPSTIYGHVASALGELPAADSFRFAYRFTSRAVTEDLEHQHIIRLAARSKLPDGSPKNTEGTVQPVKREFLFDARLELYLDRPEWRRAFESPAWVVVLGRSQDLASVIDVAEVELERRPRFYLEDTILPFEYRPRTTHGATVLMPRYVAPAPRREALFARFVVVEGRLLHDIASTDPSRRLISIDGSELEAWVDPTSPEVSGVQRGLVFDGFTGG